MMPQTDRLKFPNLTLSDLAFAILLWMLLILRYGYIYGAKDHIELLPYVLFLKNPALFPHDLFIRSLHASTPNERTVVAHLLLPFTGHLRITVFLLHFLNTVLMMLALVKLAQRFIANKYVAWVAVYVSIVVLFDKGLGGSEMYSPSIQASDMSCMIIAWALNVFLDRRYLLAAAMMSIATFIHVLEGFDVMAVLSIMMLMKYLWDKEISLKELAAFYGVYILTAGIYLIFIFRAKTGGAVVLSQPELFEIMFAFRHPHHFIFTTFPLFNKALCVFCILISYIFYQTISKDVYRFIAIGISILLVYIISVDVLHIVFIANFQWYKIVEWTKFFGVVAAFGLAFRYVSSYFADQNRILDYGVTALGFAALCLMGYQYSIGTFAIGYKQYNEKEIALCTKVKDITRIDAVFVQPFEMTALKFYGQRSSYVEFKAIAKNQKDLKTWYERVQEVFGLDYHVDADGFGMQDKANAHLDHLDEAQLAKLKNEGVTNMICRTNKYAQTHKLILSENGYFVYQL